MARDHDEPPEAWAWGAGRYERDDGRREHVGLMHVEQLARDRAIMYTLAFIT